MEQFLNSLNLNKYVEKFKEQEIDLEVARKLTEEDLKELGLPLGPRKKFLEAIQSKSSFTSASTSSTTPSAPATVSPVLTPVDLIAATQNPNLPLDTRRDIQQSSNFFKQSTAQLNKVTGVEYFFVIDFLAWYKACDTFKGFLDADSAHVKRQLGYCLAEYVASIVGNLEIFCKDQISRDTLNAKCHRRAIVVEPVNSAEKVNPSANSNQVMTLSLQNGALHCTVCRFLNLCGTFPNISSLF